MILRLFPNGQTPLTAVMSKMGSEATDSPVFHWWEKELPTQRATVTGVYTDVLSTAYVSGGAAAATLYVKMSSDDASQFKTSDVVLLRDASDYAVDVVARVSAAPVQNGASSYITVVLLEADDNSASHDLSDCDTALVIGTMNEEGTTSPTAKAYNPTEYYNYTQIWKNSAEMTGTAMATKLRTGVDPWAEDIRDCLELHSIEMEKSFLWGTRTTGTGTGGKPRRTTNGIIRQLSTNVLDYYTDTDYSGQTWLQGGETWLDEILEQIFRYGSNEKLVLAGSGAILGINRLAKASGQITINPMTVSYGLKVGQWITPFGTIYLKTHPLFSYEATDRNTMLVLEPKNLKYRYLKGRDTKLLRNVQTPDADERKDMYITEAGLELHHEKTFGILYGVGLDNGV